MFDGIAQENKNALTLIMDVNKQYKFEVYNRNSFSDEQKKEKRTLIIFVIVGILVIAFLFLRGAYLERIQFEEKVEGILLYKKKGSRGSYIIKVFDIKSNNNLEYVYNNFSNYGKLEIGDSIFKDFNSHIVNIYRKKNGTYIFFHSFSISRW